MDNLYTPFSGENSTMSHWRSNLCHLTFIPSFELPPFSLSQLIINHTLYVGFIWSNHCSLSWCGMRHWNVNGPSSATILQSSLINHKDHILTFLHRSTFHLCPLRFSYQIFHTLHCQILLPFILHVSPKTEG